MVYVDGYLLAVANKNLKEYIKMAKMGKNIWEKQGALGYFEGVGEDMSPKGAGIKFPKVLQTKPGEKVIFSFIVFRSKKHRDSVNKKVMNDPIMDDPKYKDKPMPFDMKRMVYGGFKSLVYMR